jgi:hypothetical protein
MIPTSKACTTTIRSRMIRSRVKSRSNRASYSSSSPLLGRFPAKATEPPYYRQTGDRNGRPLAPRKDIRYANPVQGRQLRAGPEQADAQRPRSSK